MFKLKPLSFLALAFVLLGLVPLAFLARPVAAGTLTEGFESFTALSQPASPSYTFSQTTAGQSFVVATPAIGTRSYQHDANSNQKFALGVDQCSFIWSAAIHVAGNVLPNVEVRNTANTMGVIAGFTVSSGQTLMSVTTSGGTSGNAGSANFNIGTLLADTFYAFELDCPSEGNLGDVVLKSLNSPVVGLLTLNNVQQNSPRSDVRIGGTSIAFLDNLGFRTADSSIAAVATASPAPVSLVGFEVSPDGNTIITRENPTGGHTTIRTYGGQSLVQNPTSLQSCALSDGVSALGNFVSFTDCNATPTGNQVDRIRIRSPTLGAPVFPETCRTPLGVRYCDPDPGHEVLVSVPPALQQIGILSSSAYDYRSACSGCEGGSTVLISWTFSDRLGNVGVFSTEQSSDFDTSQSTIISVDPTGSAPQQICSFNNHAGTQGATENLDLLAVADNNVAGQLFKVTATRGTTNPAVSISRMYSLGAFQDPQVVGCGENRLFFITFNGFMGVVKATPTGQQTPLWTTTVANAGGNRGGAMSLDGQCVAYTTLPSSGTKLVHVLNATTGTQIYTATIPSGTYYQMAVSQHCQSLWIATSTNIQRFDIHAGFNSGSFVSEDGGTQNNDAGEPCTGVACAPASGTAVPCNTATVGPGFFDVEACTLSTTIGGPSGSGGWYISLMMIVGFSFGFPAILYGIAEENKIKVPKGWYLALMGGGAILGVVTAFSFGVLGVTVLFILCVLVAGVIYGRLFFGRQAA